MYFPSSDMVEPQTPEPVTAVLVVAWLCGVVSELFISIIFAGCGLVAVFSECQYEKVDDITTKLAERDGSHYEIRGSRHETC